MEAEREERRKKQGGGAKRACGMRTDRTRTFTNLRPSAFLIDQTARQILTFPLTTSPLPSSPPRRADLRPIQVGPSGCAASSPASEEIFHGERCGNKHSTDAHGGRGVVVVVGGRSRCQEDLVHIPSLARPERGRVVASLVARLPSNQLDVISSIDSSG